MLNEELKPEISKDHLKELRGKADFVDELSKTLTKVMPSIEKAELKVFANKEHPDWVQEYLLVHWKGGGISCKSNNLNSLSATFTTLGEMLNGGNYDLTENYKKQCNAPNSIKII